MIQETLTRNRKPAITSDQWHVVHARWVGRKGTRPPFSRDIVSEHDDRTGAVSAAETLLLTIVRGAGDRPIAERDQVFVRKPNFKSLKFARRREAGKR